MRRAIPYRPPRGLPRSVVEELAERARHRMRADTTIPDHLIPLVWATNDVATAERLWAIGIRSFEAAESALPHLATLEANHRAAMIPPEGERLARKRRVDR